MAKGIDKINYFTGSIILEKSIPGKLFTIEPESKVGFIIEWEAGVTDADKEKPIIWNVRENSSSGDIIRTEILSAYEIFYIKLDKIQCGSYTYFIEVNLANTSTPKGIFVKGYAPPRIITSKWSISSDGDDVREGHEFNYGDIIHLGLETEGMNGDCVYVQLYRRVQRGGGVSDDQFIMRYFDVAVIDGEINVALGNTYQWFTLIKSPKDVEEFYVKIESTDGKFISDGKDNIHARFLRVQNRISNTRKIDSYNNSPVKIGDTDKSSERISLATVYFRPIDSWNGEFGFDWLREHDNGLERTVDPAYNNIIEGGYFDGRTDLTGGPTGTAYIKMKSEYQKLFMGNTGHSTNEYFVPYLTLFSKEFVDNLSKTLLVEPRCYADLKVLVAIKDKIDRLEFEYDKTLLNVDKNILKDNAKTDGLVKSQDVSIKVTCLKDLPSDKEIKIYAHPTNGQPKVLAGKIIILKNDATVRKNMNFVLVDVTTNVTSIPIIGGKTGVFGATEEKNLHHSLHQALIVPNIVKTTLDLSTNPDFQKGGKHIEIKKSGVGLIAYENKANNNDEDSALYSDTLNLFLNSTNAAGVSNKITYCDYFTLFKFGLQSNSLNLLGAVEKIGTQNVIMFTEQHNDNCTLNHETLHGLGLYHTHRDSKPLNRAGYRYVFPCAIKNSPYQLSPNLRDSTDNVMSYRPVTKSTWRWQWNIINPKISEK